MSHLSDAEKRKYALAIRRVEYGVWGHAVSLFREITLTSRGGDALLAENFGVDFRNRKVGCRDCWHKSSECGNCPKRFGSDFGKLIAVIRKRGYDIEYCGCFELTPDNQLLHWHGLFRVAGGFLKLYDGRVKDIVEWQGDDLKWHSGHIDANRKALGDYWNKFHGAFRVEVEAVYSMEQMQAYITKHMVKDYLVDEYLTVSMRNKFLVSHGWMRPGYKDIISQFRNWWVNGTGEVWMSKRGYRVMNMVIERWCKNEPVLIKMEWGHLTVDGSGVRDAELYAYVGG